MSEEQIKYMTNRFLGWKLPKNFRPDAGISYNAPPYAETLPPTGTNLFDILQAEAMVRYLVEGAPDAERDRLKAINAQLVEALKIAGSYVSLCYHEEGGEEAAAAWQDLQQCDAALKAARGEA